MLNKECRDDEITKVVRERITQIRLEEHNKAIRQRERDAYEMHCAQVYCAKKIKSMKETVSPYIKGKHGLKKQKQSVKEFAEFQKEFADPLKVWRIEAKRQYAKWTERMGMTLLME